VLVLVLMEASIRHAYRDKAQSLMVNVKSFLVLWQERRGVTTRKRERGAKKLMLHGLTCFACLLESDLNQKPTRDDGS